MHLSGTQCQQRQMESSLMERSAMQAVDNWSNFEAYRLQRPVGLIRTDLHRSPFRESLGEVSRVLWPSAPLLQENSWLLSGAAPSQAQSLHSDAVLVTITWTGKSTCESLSCLSQVMDAVVCDPPYGVRAGGRKSQSNPECKIRDRTTHITSTAPYFLGQQHLLSRCCAGSCA